MEVKKMCWVITVRSLALRGATLRDVDVHFRGGKGVSTNDFENFCNLMSPGQVNVVDQVNIRGWRREI